MKQLQKQINTLKFIVALLAALLLTTGALVIRLYRRGTDFEEINAQRINIVEKDGRLRMAISNHERQDPGAYNGKKIPKRDRPAGFIFFNDDGDEDGGLVYDGNKQGASMVYSIDQYKGDQIMQLQYQQDSTGSPQQYRSYGLKLWDRDDRHGTAELLDYVDSLKKTGDTSAYRKGIEKIKAEGWLGRERMFIGKEPDGGYGLTIRDINGNPRLRILVDKQNHPLIETIDENGNVTKK